MIPTKKQIVIKVTMNEAEYDSIVELSEQLDRPLAGTVRELIRFAALTGTLGAKCVKMLEERMPKDELQKILKEMSAEDTLSFLRVRLFMLQLAHFSPTWDTNKMFVDK
jgi:hypothetical protein